jgi:hypothetical protein
MVLLSLHSQKIKLSKFKKQHKSSHIKIYAHADGNHSVNKGVNINGCGGRI